MLIEITLKHLFFPPLKLAIINTILPRVWENSSSLFIAGESENQFNLWSQQFEDVIQKCQRPLTQQVQVHVQNDISTRLTPSTLFIT